MIGLPGLYQCGLGSCTHAGAVAAGKHGGPGSAFILPITVSPCVSNNFALDGRCYCPQGALALHRVDATYKYWLLVRSQHNATECNLVIGDY